MIKAICFDLDGVYFNGDSFSKFRNIIGKNVSQDKIIEVYHKSEISSNFKRGLISEKDYWDYVRTELRCELSNKEIFKALRDSYTVNTDVAEIVKQTRKLGIKTCLCSNNFETRIRELDLKFNFLKDFDVQVFSYKFGVLKPSMEIFQELIRKSGVKPNEIAYSDDLESNLEVPKLLGITSFIFGDIDNFILKLNKLGVNYK